MARHEPDREPAIDAETKQLHTNADLGMDDMN